MVDGRRGFRLPAGQVARMNTESSLQASPRVRRTDQGACTGRATRSRPLAAVASALSGPVAILAGLVLWKLVVVAGDYPQFVLPAPERVAARFAAAVADGTWWGHTRTTLVESLLGFGLGCALATTLGYALAQAPYLERLLAPYIAASQALPVIAIAPLLLLWFGFGLLPKVLVAALVVFFPILVNTVTGLRGIDPSLREMALISGASRAQLLALVELPLSLPTLLSGVKIGFTLAITGATVAEFMGADRGLGLLLNVSKGLFDTPLLFVALVTLVALAMLAYATVSLLERLLVRW